MAGQIADADNPEEIARLLTARFRMISQALGPVIGNGGVTALFERSFYVAGGAHPWVSDFRDHAEHAGDFASIEALFAARTAREATQAGVLIVDQFCDLLGEMVGYSLSERLLRPVLMRSVGNPAAKGNSDE
jgi:hypothetical protein